MKNEIGALERVALVTGVTRRIGIGTAVVRRLIKDGFSVLASGWHAHDEEMPWSADLAGPSDLIEEILARNTEGPKAKLEWVAADLLEADQPAWLVNQTIERFGAIDVVVAAHARSSHTSLSEVSAGELDLCFKVNARACVLLAQALEQRFDEQRGHGRLLLFTSGQHIAPMADEIAYAVSKGAIHQMTRSLSDVLIDKGITVNCINPGPVDTGYLEGELHQTVADMFPAKRWGQGEDVANLVSWLTGLESGWITGQVIDSEGGFRR